MIKIVSHLSPRHLDDWLAISLLKYVYPTACVEYRHPQDIPKEFYSDKNIFLIDVGGDLNPSQKNYDHHQDENLVCSLSLILVYELNKPKFISLKTVQTIDVIDRFGFKEACNKGLVVPNKEVDELRRTLLLVNPDELIGEEIINIFTKICNNEIEDDFNTFIKELYKALDKKGLLEEAKQVIQEEERKFKEKLEKIEKINVNNLTIVFSAQSLAPRHSQVFSEMNVDIIVERNSMNPNHSSFIINTASEKTKSIDFSKLFHDLPIVFKHKTGFITVVNMEFDSFVQVVKERLTKF